MEESRTKNSIKNISTGAFAQIVNKLMEFVVRTVFIKILDTEYLGVNGLFTNVLTILSFAELGIGTAIIFNMYKPIAENDKNKIKALMDLYKRAYNIIGVVVFVLGLCVIPFMKFMVKETPDIKENINFIYILFLINTSASYFFTYKKSIISAHQKQNIINNIDSIFYFVRSILEIVFLVLTRNYIVYLLIKIICTIIENIFISKKADKMYPYLKEKNNAKLSKEESSNIFSNVKSLIVYKFGGVIMDGTDNILISSMVNVSVVGLCSNYSMIINAVKNILSSAINGLTASIGNLNAVGTAEKKEKIFYQLTFMNYVIYSFCAIAFIVLLNPFVKIWLGEKYILSIGVVIALAVSFFINGLRNPGYIYRTTMGLFQKGKITPYIGAISNIVFSIVLCKLYGVIGIFIATSIAQLVSYSWIDPYLIHKHEFKTPVRKYFKKFVIYILVFTISTIITLSVTNLIKLEGILGLFIKGFIVCVIPNLINLVLFYRTEEFKELKQKMLIPILSKIFKNKVTEN